MNPIYVGDDYDLYSNVASSVHSSKVYTSREVYSMLYLANHSLKYRLVYTLLEAYK